MNEAGSTERVRTAEVIATLCLATDLGMGFPFEHGFHATLTAMRLCDALGIDAETSSRTYYASLLMYAGCTVDGEVKAGIFRGSMTEHHTHRQFGSQIESLIGVAKSVPAPGVTRAERVFQMATGLPRAGRFVGGHFNALCEVAGMLAERMGLDASVHGMFALLTERWDGKSVLKRAERDEIPLPIRICQVARDAAYQRLVGDDDHVIEVIRSRGGKAFDPDVVAVFLNSATDILGPSQPLGSVWDEVLGAEPRPNLTIEGPEIDRALSAVGSFSDLVSPYLTGHCGGVSELAGSAAAAHGFAPDVVEVIRRAALVHDVGRTAVAPGTWLKPAPLTADEREQVRLHPYHTERVLVSSPFMSGLAPIASAHHERLDGSGYHRGIDMSALTPEARLLAAADAFRSKTEPRPYREALTDAEARDLLLEKAQRGQFDPVMVSAVLEAAGQPSPRPALPSGLTEREAEVIGLLSRGLRTKQIARALDISPKTADRHIQNSYRKMGVSSRAAAALFAAENGIVPR